MTNLTFLIVTSLLVSQSPEWKDVPLQLAEKHAGEANIIQLNASEGLTNLTGRIRAAAPTHVAFVMRPEEIDFPAAVALKRMMRAIDDDPYDDAVWGLVTGPDAASAKRIASSREPQTIHAILSTTGVDDAAIPGPIYCLSDAYPEGCWRIKQADGQTTNHQSSADMSHIFADGWESLDPDLILTSSHASQRNLEMPFSRGNIVPKSGAFVTAPNATLIDYKTGRALETDFLSSVQLTLKRPLREKVWLAAGNCLIADNLRPGENMVMTALGFGKVNQFVGYMTTTWFGEIGWGTWKHFREGLSLVDAYFRANRELVESLVTELPEAKDFNPVFSSAEDYDRLFKEVQRFKPLARVSDKQKAVGRLWDRDATIFYGDPLQKVYLNRGTGR